jgi:hypothetical protein
VVGKAIPFLLDENVPAVVGKLLRERGHLAENSRDILPRGTADPLVAQAANERGAVIVTWDNHFDRHVNRSARGEGVRFPRAGRLTFNLPEPDAGARVPEILSIIEHEYAECQKLSDKRLIVEIARSFVKIYR